MTEFITIFLKSDYARLYFRESELFYAYQYNDLNDLDDEFSIYPYPEGYLELRQMSKMELLAKIVYGF